MKTAVKISIVALFSALCAILTYFTKIPSPTGGYTHIGDVAIYVAALLFGSQIGGLVGLIGPVVTDLLVGYPRWYVTLIAHGLQGVIAGFARKKNTLLQFVLTFSAGVVMSLTYFGVNIFIKGLAPAIASLFRDVFGQTLISVIISVPLAQAISKRIEI